MKTKWLCEKCDEEFYNEQECIQHELECDPFEYHFCYKCGKNESWTKSNDGQGHKKESWHKIWLGRMGWGSSLDGCDVNFELCDECLCEFIKGFKHKEYIYDSGSNSSGVYLEEIGI